MLSGTVEGFEVELGSDSAEPIWTVDAVAAEKQGATVTQHACVIGDNPTINARELRPFLRRPIRTTGQFVVTPSGNAHFVCHVAAQPFLRSTPSQAIVVDNAVCTLPDRHRATDSRIVLTPSGHLTLTCHLQPAA